MKPRTELLLRQGARTVCLVGAGVVLAAMMVEAVTVLLGSPGFVLFLKVALLICLGLAAAHGFLWAVGRDNRERIKELKQSIEVTKADRNYLIYPSAIQNYVEVIAPASVVMLADLAADGYTGEICQCIDAYVAREIDAETFIARMNEEVKAE